jgi:hypothetical protein
MFHFLDFLFQEEKSKHPKAKIYGYTESYFLQESVRSAEIESESYDITYDEEQTKTAIIHARQDIVLLVALISRTNILLRWIRFLILIFLCLLIYFLITFKF